jgi:hypothetical protein
MGRAKGWFLFICFCGVCAFLNSVLGVGLLATPLVAILISVVAVFLWFAAVEVIKPGRSTTRRKTRAPKGTPRRSSAHNRDKDGEVAARKLFEAAFATESEGAPVTLDPPTEHDFREAVLLILLDGDGQGRAARVTDAVGRRLRDDFTAYDIEELKNGELRWRSTVQNIRRQMKNDGLLESETERGLWVLTSEGRKVAETLRA